MPRPRLVGAMAALALTAPTAVLATPAFADAPTTTLHVDVSNETRCCAAVSGATVTLYDATTGAQFGSAGTTTSDGVDFAVPAGTYTAKVSKSGFATEYSTMTTVTAEDVSSSSVESTSVGLNVPSADLGKAHGRTTSNGQTVSNWNGYGYVFAYDADTGSQYRETYFNGNGDGEWGMTLAPGTYKFKLWFNDYTTSSQKEIWAGGADQATASTFSVTAAGNVEVPTFDVTQAVSGPSLLTGKVTDATGRGMPGVAAHLISSSATDRSQIVSDSYTDATGTYSFPSTLTAGDYRLWFSDYDGEYLDGFYGGSATPVAAPEDGTVPAGAATVAISTTPTTATTVSLTKRTLPAQTSGVTGVVTDDAGTPVYGAAVRLWNDETGNSRYASTARDGSWRVTGEQLPPGTYSVAVYIEDSAYDGQWNTLTTTVPTHGVSTVPTLKLVRRGSVSGTISQLTHTEEPYLWADLALYDLDGQEVDSTSTDNAGRYEFEYVTPGTYVLAATEGESYDLYDGYHNLVPAFFGGSADLASAKKITVAAGRASTADITLTSKLTGRGVAIAGAPAVGKTLTAKAGTWSRKVGTSFSYAWKIGTKVVGTSATYKVTAAASAKTVTLTVTASNPSWESGSASTSVKVVSAAVTAAQAKVTSTNAAIAQANAALKSAQKSHKKAAITKAKNKLASLKKQLKKDKDALAQAQKAAQ